MITNPVISFKDLPDAELIIDGTYEGGKKGNSGDDPLSKLMGCENQGGFRPVGARNGMNTKFCILYSDLSKKDWPDYIENQTGKFIYYGDNRVPGRDLHDTPKKGNLILKYSFNLLHNGNRKNIPPFFVFSKGTKGRDVVFKGLAVPGASEVNESEELMVISTPKNEEILQNYKAIFTILDVPTISREWIKDLHNNNPFSENAPTLWLEWVHTGKYKALIKEENTQFRKSDSFPQIAYDSKIDYELSKKTRFWLFNVYFSKDSVVWEKSKQFDVAAMQYEYGRETSSSVTKHINIINNISEGDYIIAYTGNKGFLGYGIVNKSFFVEDNPEKYIRATGANWRQRVGVNWTRTLDVPVNYRGSSFVADIGIIGSPVMGSSTIFEVSQEGFNFMKDLIDNEPPEISKLKPKTLLTQIEVVNHIHSYIGSKGFLYSREDVINLFLSIKTKPFVILSGISGTGKTKIVQWFAESLGATEENGQFHLIPIRPDWNDGSDLLGYVDIKGDFKEGPLTKIIKQANETPYLPFFVLLDEMNLARVEYYFSDILSVMETRRWENDQIITSNLLSKELIGENLKVPSNLYIIGTVNMDETTHPFSKKVLDRANTIEFNRVELSYLEFLKEIKDVAPVPIFNENLASKYLHLKDVYADYPDLVVQTTEELDKINKSLQIMNAHVGYRVRDEICFYLAYNAEDQLMSYEEALDHCILQKILPRMMGSDSRVERVLKELYRLFTNREYADDDSYEASILPTKYPNSAGKVAEMLRRLRDDGFTSFWIS